MRAWLTSIAIASLAFAALTSSACDKYVAPPIPSLQGVHDGLLDDPAQPIVIDFAHPVDPSTLRVKVVLFQPDSTGLLADEHGDPTVDLHPFFAHDPAADNVDVGGTATLANDAMSFTITLPARLPVGPKLAVLVEPGLTSTSGESTAVRKRLLFTYAVTCSGSAASTLPSGAYFFLLDVEVPLGTQIKLFADIVVDPKTGLIRGQFTRAGRLPDPTRCTPACDNGNVCQTVPAHACVVPSTVAGTTDEFVDFYADATSAIGYTVTVTGCAIDQPGGLIAFTTAPANLAVASPPVTVDGLVMIASFSPDATGIMRATGGITGDDIVTRGNNPINFGAGHGTVAARFIPADQAPMIPAAPATAP